VRLIEVRWPSGTRQTLRDVAGDRVVTITEPE
jgi:ASPIC and UnbV